MARRSNKKLQKAHHDFMITDERDRLIKKRRRQERRAKKEQKAKVEAILCEAFDKTFSVGEDTKNAVPHVGAPVSTDADIEMKASGVSKRGKARKNKKALRRLEKIRQRQAQRSAMQA